MDIGTRRYHPQHEQSTSALVRAQWQESCALQRASAGQTCECRTGHARHNVRDEPSTRCMPRR